MISRTYSEVESLGTSESLVLEELFSCERMQIRSHRIPVCLVETRPRIFHIVVSFIPLSVFRHFRFRSSNGTIDTGKLYPILLRSNLPREALGHIWSLANKTAPGQLIKEELYLVLALVALAQVRSFVHSISSFRIGRFSAIS